MKAYVCLGLIVALSLPPMANAGGASWSDADDSRHLLDIATYGHGHLRIEGAGRLVTHSFSTYETWSSDVIEGGGGSRIDFWFDTAPGRGYERSVHIEPNPDGTVYGRLEDLTRKRPRTIGFVRVWRPDDSSLTIALTRSQLGRPASYRWVMRTLYRNEAEGCSLNIDCFDGTSKVRHEL